MKHTFSFFCSFRSLEFWPGKKKNTQGCIQLSEQLQTCFTGIFCFKIFIQNTPGQLFRSLHCISVQNSSKIDKRYFPSLERCWLTHFHCQRKMLLMLTAGPCHHALPRILCSEVIFTQLNARWKPCSIHWLCVLYPHTNYLNYHYERKFNFFLWNALGWFTLAK